MDYKETIDYLYHATPAFERVGAKAYKEGLENTLAMDEHFGHPHRKYKTVHVAGTNGKGSCSHTLAAMLQAEGLKTGLFTSPHLVDFRERIKVNGLCVSEEWVVDFVEKEKNFFEPLKPSFFELTTAMAFKYFAEQEVDVAVIEVGLGGRLDCTNIISPMLSVITNISFDHTQFLGHTLQQIAAEKAGIIKKEVPVVVGETCNETKPVFIEKARQENAPVYFAEEMAADPLEASPFGLFGNYQEKNKRTILCAARVLGLSDDAIVKGLADVCSMTGFSGRWQTIRHNPLVVCDTGHNLAGWQYLAPQIKTQPCRRLRIVFGMVDDKDIDNIMRLLPNDAIYYWTQASTHRAIPHQIVKEKGDALQLTGQSFPSVLQAYCQALNDSSADDFIFVGGSSYVVADLLTDIGRQS